MLRKPRWFALPFLSLADLRLNAHYRARVPGTDGPDKRRSNAFLRTAGTLAANRYRVSRNGVVSVTVRALARCDRL